MLYFRFNKDNFDASQKEVCKFDFIEIESFFFNKLNKEVCLSKIGVNSLCDVIGIPSDAFSIDNESIGNLDGALKFVLSEYVKLPIEELDNKSLSDLGIYIEFCKSESNESINLKLKRYMKENNFEYLEEEVMWKNMTDGEKISKFSMKLNEIETKGNELIIVDPYIFSNNQDRYCNMLDSILNSSKSKKIIIVTDKKNFKEKSFDKISDKIRKIIDLKYSDDFHDRFWIANRKKGFYTGTSFNGIGKKISLINNLSYDDVKEIIDELKKKNVIC
ncbi:hypothetical protein QYB77_002584 [Clostridium perfringens]|uniref:Uncharacterized protein n=1 Tax=Clostridium perfringens TaxID=1502 RepID=A0A8H9QXB4_CLOPF|nr:hypothetical protein [Clostridium perfringens]ELC8460401.1 hypothetical protein [Clostridium perfringens]HAT4307850.1 hypothetical protein [Clostridium perfringens]